MKKGTIRQIVVILTTIATITVNGLANALPLNGQSTGEISNRFDIYFVPANYVFSIWGLIYLLLLAYTVYQALPVQRDNAALDRVGYLYLFANLANIAWLFLWHYEVFPLTLVVMLVILGFLIAIYLSLEICHADVSKAFWWLVHLPFSVYLGWITVATIANATQLLFYLNWGGWGIDPAIWAVIMLAAATAITAAVIFTRDDPAYPLVIIWATTGIAVKHGDVPLVSIAGWAAAGVVAVLLVVQFLRGQLIRFKSA